MQPLFVVLSLLEIYLTARGDLKVAATRILELGLEF